ncbi:MAG: hypothetical protein IPO22_11800 [Anaerolineales bacterium]|nr:hypothetical protein [Anaerolineales bacterium]
MKTAPFKIVLAILAGPLAAWIFPLFNFVLSPPNQGFTELLYLPICMLGFPTCIVLIFQKKLLGWKILAGFALSIIAPLILFILTSPAYLPSGMSTCKLVDSNGSKVKYACVDTSSDDPTYHREFTVEGIEGWPIMRVTDG